MTDTETTLGDYPNVLTRNKAANAMVSDLCHGRKDWIMSIPARRDIDPDLVIGASLRDIPALVRAAQLSDARERERAALAEQRAEASAAARELAASWGEVQEYLRVCPIKITGLIHRLDSVDHAISALIGPLPVLCEIIWFDGEGDADDPEDDH